MVTHFSLDHFIKFSEQTIETKIDHMEHRLYYSEQYTSGEPGNLVCSCFRMPPDRGYKEKKKQLGRHFGNKIIITRQDGFYGPMRFS